ncbi:hypothetical protein [Enterovibrio norvegicus]|uniref:hypothetical protein n=1 Tax=Enterovibrio norvegicus TaxID=188144 RepID=UPI000C84DC6E|nr:hypothetical protein [Enterovibrio norvegicus]PMH64512.1 hypothetical protein BCU62_15775 [Enterovibrio norvegicus]
MNRNQTYRPSMLSIAMALSFCALVPSTQTSASVSDIKANVQNIDKKRLGKDFEHNSQSPGYQVSAVPAIDWTPSIQLDRATGRPSINLDNAIGSPRIDLSRSSGAISSTTGVSNSIKDYVNNKTNAVKPPVEALYWVEVQRVYGQNNRNVPSLRSGYRCYQKGAQTWANKNNPNPGEYDYTVFMCL